ncbi:MAG TPA: hypothetical protein VJ123_03600 [Anaerolineales bacterium]|nr:hypothetical protein [Anaerolineales bacterium]
MAIQARRITRTIPERWLRLLPLSLFIFVTLGPLLAVLVDLVPHLSQQPEWLQLAAPQGRRLALLARSIALAVAVSAATMSLGTLGALALLTWNPRWTSRAWPVLLVTAAIPPYIHALAWTETLAWANRLLSNAGLARLAAQGAAASAWVQFMAYLPLGIGLALLSLHAVDPELVEMAQVLGDDRALWGRVVLPLARPYLLAGVGVLFTLSIADYSIPSLFEWNVYALEIFAEFSASAEPGRAFLLALPLLALTTAVILASQGRLRHAAIRPPFRPRPLANPIRWPAWLQHLQRLAVVLLVLQVAVPLISLVLLTGDWQSFLTANQRALPEIGFSFLVAFSAAGLCLLLASLLASELAHGAWRRATWALVALPLAVPAPLVGIGLALIWNRPILESFYMSPAMPVLAAAARFAPPAALLLAAHRLRTDPALLEAAKLLPVKTWRKGLLIDFPLAAPGLAAAGALTFLLSLQELGATLIVIPPGHATLTLRIYNFLHYGAPQVVAGLCLMLALLVILFGGLAAFGWARWPEGAT